MDSRQVQAGLTPYPLDPAGADLTNEAARLRQRGPATLVELPGGVVAWSIASAPLLKELLTDSRVSKDPRQHWPLFRNGTVGPEWPLFLWVAVQNMFTAYGPSTRDCAGWSLPRSPRGGPGPSPPGRGDRPALRKAVDGAFSTTLTPEEAVANGQALYGILGSLVTRSWAAWSHDPGQPGRTQTGRSR